MQLRSYFRQNSGDTVPMIAVNYMEIRYGGSYDGAADMVAGLPDTVRAIKGTDALAKAFGGISRPPAGFLFDASGRVAFDFGGVADPDDPGHLTRDKLERALSKLR